MQKWSGNGNIIQIWKHIFFGKKSFEAENLNRKKYVLSISRWWFHGAHSYENPVFFYLKPFFSWRLNVFPKSVPLAFLHPWMDFKFISRICVFSGWLHWSTIQRKKSTMALAIIIMTFRLKNVRILRCFKVIWCKTFIFTLIRYICSNS